VAGTEPALPLAPPTREEALPLLSAPTEGENLVADYRHLGLTLGRHPLALLRSPFERRGVLRATELAHLDDGTRVAVAGLVTTRQKPSTASGVTFVTLEDDSGHVNLIVWKNVGAMHRRALFEARLMEVEGRLQREGLVTHVIVERLYDRSRWLGRLVTRSRDFR
jgi:error-prone DNA polymerase